MHRRNQSLFNTRGIPRLLERERSEVPVEVWVERKDERGFGEDELVFGAVEGRSEMKEETTEQMTDEEVREMLLSGDCEFGGNLLRIRRVMPPGIDADEVRKYASENGTYFECCDAYFIEGWDEYFQPENISGGLIDFGEMHVPPLGGLTQEQLEMVIDREFEKSAPKTGEWIRRVSTQ